MNRTLLLERFTTSGITAGNVLILTGFSHPERGPVRCPAAPAVSGWLRRRGLPVTQGPAPAPVGEFPCPPPDDTAVVFAVTYLDGEGRAVGVATATSSPGLAAAAADAVNAWRPVMRTRRAVLAATDPLCLGERDSLARAWEALATASGPVYVLGQLTRGKQAAEDLSRHGAVFTGSLDQVPEGSTVLFPAHGTPLSVRAEAAARGMRIIDTTCPLVSAVHETARRYADRGDTIALIGRPGHAAVPGISSQAPESVRLVAAAEEAATLEVDDPFQLSYLVQTGIPVEEATSAIAALRSRFPMLRGPRPDQFCYAASDRLATIRRAAEASDAVIVAGTADCADTRQVIEAVAAAGAEAYLAEAADDVRPEWLDRIGTVGLTAGHGADPGLTGELLATLSGLGPLSVTRVTVSTEVVAPARPVGHGTPPGSTAGDPVSADPAEPGPPSTLPRIQPAGAAERP